MINIFKLIVSRLADASQNGHLLFVLTIVNKNIIRNLGQPYLPYFFTIVSNWKRQLNITTKCHKYRALFTDSKVLYVLLMNYVNQINNIAVTRTMSLIINRVSFWVRAQSIYIFMTSLINTVTLVTLIKQNVHCLNPYWSRFLPLSHKISFLSW